MEGGGGRECERDGEEREGGGGRECGRSGERNEGGRETEGGREKRERVKHSSAEITG